MRVQDNSGGRISQSIAPGIVVRAARDTQVTLAWQPNAGDTTLAGPRSYDSWVFSASSTPFSWMPQATVAGSAGEMLDSVTGEVGEGMNLLAAIPLRFSRLETGSAIGYRALRSRAGDDARQTLFTERNLQVTGAWHFSSRLYLRLTHQQSTFQARPPFAGLATELQAQSKLSSILLSYQRNWQTRLYIGALTSSNQTGTPEPMRTKATQIFAKFSYAFSD
jgi:hypothetical protein